MFVIRSGVMFLEGYDEAENPIFTYDDELAYCFDTREFAEQEIVELGIDGAVEEL